MVVLFYRVRRQYDSLGYQLVGFLVVCLLLLTACGSSSSTTSSSANSKARAVVPPNDLITPGSLTVGTDATYPPFEFIDTATYTPVGFDIDLITTIAQRMGLKTKIVMTKFDTIIDDLVSKRFDVVISEVSITPERQKKVDFVPYLGIGESLLVQKGNPKNIKSLDDLCGLSVGVQLATRAQDNLEKASSNCKKESRPAINTIILQNQTDVINLLVENRVDATYQESAVTDYYTKQHPNQFEVGGSQVNVGRAGIVVRKGDISMFNAIATAFKAVKSVGTYHALIVKWGLFNEEISVIERQKMLPWLTFS